LPPDAYKSKMQKLPIEFEDFLDIQKVILEYGKRYLIIKYKQDTAEEISEILKYNKN
jgi:hypothetical protein